MTLPVAYLIFILPLIFPDARNERKKTGFCADRLERVVQKVGSNVFTELQQKLNKQGYVFTNKTKQALCDENLIDELDKIIDQDIIKKILNDENLCAELCGKSTK